MRILGVCGSLQAASANLTLLRRAVTLAPAGVELVVFDGLRDLPHFNPDLEAGGALPESVAGWRRQLSASDAVLIVSPEYGHSLPGVLKNAIDWVIGSGELERKCVALTASTAGYGRGLLGLAAVRTTLGAVNATIVGGVPIERGVRADDEVRGLVRALVEAASASKGPGALAGSASR